MKILAFGDLHFDHWLRSGRNPLAVANAEFEDLDALLILGDLANSPERGWPNALGWLKYMIDPARIWVLPGNHDYYGFRLDGDDRLRELAEREGANFLQKSVLELGGVRFLACTLWSDFRLRGDKMRRKDMIAAARSMNDYRLIRKHEGGPIARPADTALIFDDHLAWLTGELEKPFEGRTVVLTHHVPSRSVSGKVDEISPAFGSDLDLLIQGKKPDLWLCGHTHRHLEATVGETRVRNVSLGYPSEVDVWRHREILLSGLMDTDLPGLLVKE